MSALVHQRHVVKETRCAAATADKQIEPFDGTDLFQAFAFNVAEPILAFFSENGSHIHSDLLFNIFVEIEEVQPVLIGRIFANRGLSSTHKSDQEEFHATKVVKSEKVKVKSPQKPSFGVKNEPPPKIA